jgi:hypothetical protein
VIPEYSFVFVCQSGTLEIQAMLLAASLHRFVSCPYEMIAALPQPESQYGAPDPSTMKMLEELGVRFAPISNQIDPSYPIGNKISAMAIATRGRRRIFLDTDMLCMRPLSADCGLDGAFAAVPAERVTWGKDTGDWNRAYALFGLSTPAVRVRTVGSREETLPYYNAGFITAASDVADALARAWLECAQVLDRSPQIANKRPWLDQIALPVAVTRLGLPHHFLDEAFNCPAKPRLLTDAALPFFCHYHRVWSLKHLPVLNRQVRALVDTHPILREQIMRHRQWREILSDGYGLLDAFRMVKSVRRRLAPIGTRRDRVTSRLAKHMRKALGSLRDFRG